MGKEVAYKQIVKSAGIYSIAVAVGRMASFVLLPVYTRYLTPADYGVIELLELTSFIFSALVGMRIGDALFYYYARANDATAKERVICTVFAGSSLLGLAGGALGCLLATPLSQLVFGTPQYTSCFRLVFSSFALSLLAETGFCYLRALDRPIAYVIASLSRLVLGIVFNVTLLLAGFGIYALLWSSVVVTGLIATALAFVALSGTQVRNRFDSGLLGQFLRYSGPLGVSALSLFVINYGDRFFLQKFTSLGDIGIYSLAYKIGMLITYLQTPFDVYWRSQMFSIVRTDNGEQIYVRVGTYLTVSLAFVVLLFSLFTYPVLHLITPQAFWSAAEYVPWIAAAYVIRTLGAHFRCVFLLEGRTAKELYVTTFGAVACLAAYALLIPKFKLWGAVASTVVGFGVMLGVGLYQAQRVRRFPFEYRRLIGASLLAVGVSVAFEMVRPQSLWLQIALGILFAGLYPLLLAVFRFAHADETRAMASAAGALLRRAPRRLAADARV